MISEGTRTWVFLSSPLGGLIRACTLVTTVQDTTIINAAGASNPVSRVGLVDGQAGFAF